MGYFYLNLFLLVCFSPWLINSQEPDTVDEDSIKGFLSTEN